MSAMGHSRYSEPNPKSTFVRYAPNSDHSTAEFVCRLSAISGHWSDAQASPPNASCGHCARERRIAQASARFSTPIR